MSRKKKPSNPAWEAILAEAKRKEAENLSKSRIVDEEFKPTVVCKDRRGNEYTIE